MKMLLEGVCAAVMLAVASGAAFSQERAVQEEGEVYDRDFFDRFNPQTARDMLERLPGFALDTGENLRGFGGTAGNVLINGERPSSKVGVLDALSRIPANSVVRIELLRGTAGSSEAAGQTVVANIIRTSSHGTGRWQVELERAPDGRVYPAVELTVQHEGFGWQTSTNFKTFWERFPLDGERVTTAPDGQLLFSQSEHRPSVLQEAFVSTEASRALFDGELTLTGRFGYSGFLPDTERLGYQGRLPGGLPDERLVIDYDSEYLEGELGLDWTRPLSGDWSFKLLSLTFFQDLEQVQDVTSESPLSVVASQSEFIRLRDTFETVLRGTMSKSGDHRFRPEMGGELAFNRVDSNLSLLTGLPGSMVAVDLPAANVVVEEIRGEAFANLITRLNPRWSTELGLAAEYSDISVSGDAESSQSFFFAKPSAALIYTPREGIQFRIGAQQTVGQLDFNNFAASASASDDRLLAGNPALGPDQTTRVSASVDIRSQDRGAINAELFHEWRADIIEQIVLPSGTPGAANAGDGRVWGVSVNGSLPLGFLLDGALVELDAEFRDSSFTDPVTGQDREISSIVSPRLTVEFRQDIVAHRLAWGLTYTAASESTFFYANEESFSRDGETWSAFIETTRFMGLRTNLSLSNIGDRNYFRERWLYDDDRSGALGRLETTRQHRGMFVSLTVSGQF